ERWQLLRLLSGLCEPQRTDLPRTGEGGLRARRALLDLRLSGDQRLPLRAEPLRGRARERGDVMLYAQVHLTLPAWLHQLDVEERRHPDAESQVALAIDLSARNVAEGSGGPFGAAIFDGEGRLLGVGVNRVVPQTCSVAHAEMMAFMTAQQ